MDGVAELSESTHISYEEPEHDGDEALCCWISSLFVSASWPQWVLRERDRHSSSCYP